MAIRIIYLVRHGQYYQRKAPGAGVAKPAIDPLDDAAEIQRDGGLTPAGEQQADLTGQRFDGLPIDCIYTSSLPRAMQTAAMIAAVQAELTPQAHRNLWECIPHVPAKFADWTKRFPATLLQRDQEHAATAFATYFQPNDNAADRHEILVCHGNLIRYFVCRALQVSLDAWVNMDTHNCGISTIQIQPDGTCLLIAINDTGHLPRHLLTFNALPDHEESSEP